MKEGEKESKKRKEVGDVKVEKSRGAADCPFWEVVLLCRLELGQGDDSHN